MSPRLISCILSIAVGILLGSRAAAEDNPAGTSDGRRSRIASPLELAMWEAEIGESTFGAMPSDRNRTSLIVAYEKLLIYHCMPKLMKTLEYEGKPKGKPCLEYIDKTLVLDAENPVALCARDGIDSKSCDDAYAVQRVEIVRPGQHIWPGDTSPGAELDVQFEERSDDTAQYTAIEGELSGMPSIIAMKPAERAQYLPKVNRLINKLIGVACRSAKLRIVTPQPDPAEEMKELPARLRSPEMLEKLKRMPSDERKTFIERQRDPKSVETPAAPEALGTMHDLLRAFTSKKSGGKEMLTRADGVTRVRLISPRCDRYTIRAANTDPTNANAVCGREGLHTPKCVRALREYRRRQALLAPAATPQVEGTPGTPAPSNKNFSTF